MSHPERTCVGCGAKGPQNQLLRVAAFRGAAPLFDPQGKAPGRGAYLCRSEKCLEAALKRRSFERSLQIKELGVEFQNELRRVITTVNAKESG